MLRWPALSPVALASLEQVLNLNLEGCPINQSEERDCGWEGLVSWNGRHVANHWFEAFRESPPGQNDNCTEEVTFDCLVDAMTGKFHISYCTDADRLKVDRGQNSARTFASTRLPPLGMSCWLTFWCRNPNWSLLRGLNQ